MFLEFNSFFIDSVSHLLRTSSIKWKLTCEKQISYNSDIPKNAVLVMRVLLYFWSLEIDCAVPVLDDFGLLECLLKVIVNQFDLKAIFSLFQ